MPAKYRGSKKTMKRNGRKVSRKMSRKMRLNRQRGGGTIVVYGVIDPSNLSISKLSSPTAGVTGTEGAATCTINFPSPMKVTNMTYSTYKSSAQCTDWCTEKAYNTNGSQKALSLSSGGKPLLSAVIRGQAAAVLSATPLTSVVVNNFTTTNLGGATTLKTSTLDTTVNVENGGANFRMTFTTSP